jgi:hypothetical protein
MKIFALLAALFATAFSSFAELTLEDISPHFSTNAQIIWKAPTNNFEVPPNQWTGAEVFLLV